MWRAMPGLTATFNAVESIHQIGLKYQNAAPAALPAKPANPFDQFDTPEQTAAEAEAAREATPAGVQARYASESLWFWGTVVRDQVALAIGPPLLALILGWGLIWALAPRRAEP